MERQFSLQEKDRATVCNCRRVFPINNVALGINSPYYISYICLNTSSAILIAHQGIILGHDFHDFHQLSTYRSASS